MSTTPERNSLTALLRAYVPLELRPRVDAVPELEALLEGHLTAARAAWPTVPLPVEDFLRHVARHLPAEATEDVLRQLHGADLYLACACAAGTPQALLAFDQHVLRKVPSRLGPLPRATVDEVLQVLRARLLMARGEAPPRIADYSGRGPLVAWVRITAARIAGELASRDGRQELFDEPPEALARMLSTGDPENELLRKDSRELLVDVLRSVLAAMPERERALLRLHHLHGFTLDRLAALYGESRSGMQRQVAHARERLMKLTRTELASRMRLEAPELESLLGLVSSRLDLSLHRLLG
ncbi:sigma factor-like helix-turn-helix DNA-binding protein [Pyxidicoccus xibeiensis]|uniref:sigma factor-like helix-turn-helix DNA-binding protein n=1 Tax=Pyxidicoccus xibeiensis TaxID=2906759 RepID=UPI0020A800B5|nr:sigma factor-like helix-turn-helix DNA-binding protein [Pyxidicoccus xibeiensis]MCP3135954.1 RNA polymerase subunit sigma-70 [Pyxidicoccus xibeiensis]